MHLQTLLHAASLRLRAFSVPRLLGVMASLPQLSMEEVAKHNKESDCWVVLAGMVYDVTEFLPDHPGGKRAITLYAGKDATEEFDMLHDRNVLTKYLPKEACLGPVVGKAKM